MEEDCYSKFNENITTLLAIILSKRNSPKVEGLLEKVRLAISTDRTGPLVVCSGHIWEYRTQIMGGDVDYFMGTDFSDKNDHLAEIINKAKSIWSECDEEEKDHLTDIIQNMVEAISVHYEEQ